MLAMLEQETYDVYAFLPVCNVGFPFMMQADWALVTSREGIKEVRWFCLHV